MFLCCRYESEEMPAGRLIEPPKAEEPLEDVEEEVLLWSLTATAVEGLEWSGPAAFVFKASYAGRAMYSETLEMDDYRGDRLELSNRYVFRDHPGHDEVCVQIYNEATPLGTFVLGLDTFRHPNSTTDTWLDVSGTAKAKVHVTITCAPIGDDDDANVTCMDLPGHPGGPWASCVIS